MTTKIINLHNKINGKRPYFDEYIGRKVNGTEFIKDSKWANPFSPPKYDKRNSLIIYEKYAREQLWDYLEELVGKILACWCINTSKIHPIVCHGQILLKLMKEKGLIKC